MTEIMHPTYLPFERETLLSHFAPVRGDGHERERHLAYFEKSLRQWRGDPGATGPRRGRPVSELKRPYQMEKD